MPQATRIERNEEARKIYKSHGNTSNLPTENSREDRKEKSIKTSYLTSTTTRHIRTLLPSFLETVCQAYKDRPDLILAAWPEIVGSKLAPMTHAVSFQNGTLVVKVNNSTLYSLLSQIEKPRLIQCLRHRFPNTMIKTICFRPG